MVELHDLPVELIPLIVSHILKPHHLSLICRVNKTFYQCTAILLYKRASIYPWQKEAKTKVVQLFNTLATYPHLARYVRRLEIRDFPKSLGATDIGATVADALRNCTNLRSCTWTRDGSLTSSILLALQSGAYLSLRELEINGHDSGNYDPSLLPRFKYLEKLSLIMPSATVTAQLESWILATGSTLGSLTLICKTSPVITDGLLEILAPHLSNLRHFHIAGCSKVTHRGIFAILSAAGGIRSLGLEGISHRFDMSEFSHQCTQSNTLAHLRSITLTVTQALPLSSWLSHVLCLLSSAPLETFRIYSTHTFYRSPASDPFWPSLIEQHKSTLKQFSVHRMVIGLDPIREMCASCPKLEQLFVVVAQNSLQHLAPFLTAAKNLRALHINYPFEPHERLINDTDSHGESEYHPSTSSVVPPLLSPSEALSLIQHCSPTLVQFGCNARVWQVERVIEAGEGDGIVSRPKLMQYEHPDIPEQFLVVRT